MRYFIELQYNGATYAGWQIQNNAFTVQQEINNALHVLYGKKDVIETVGCGRTDAGVHAKQFYLHFDKESCPYTNEEFLYKLNCILSKNIAVFKRIAVAPNAHTRFDATAREYKYYIHQQKDAFLQETSWYFDKPLNVDLINKASQILLNTTDFGSFCKANSDNKTNICKLKKITWQQEGTKHTFTIEADRFLRNMVRAIVGTLIDVGTEKITLLQFQQIIDKQNRSAAGTSVPGNALFLTKVTYPYIK